MVRMVCCIVCWTVMNTKIVSCRVAGGCLLGDSGIFYLSYLLIIYSEQGAVSKHGAKARHWV